LKTGICAINDKYLKYVGIESDEKLQYFKPEERNNLFVALNEKAWPQF